MLVLSRKMDEVIHVGDSITVKIVQVSGQRVKLAIEAPQEVRVLRGELKEANVARSRRKSESRAAGSRSCADAVFAFAGI